MLSRQGIKPFNTLLKVAIIKNTKKPAFRNWQKKASKTIY